NISCCRITPDTTRNSGASTLEPITSFFGQMMLSRISPVSDLGQLQTTEPFAQRCSAMKVLRFYFRSFLGLAMCLLGVGTIVYAILWHQDREWRQHRAIYNADQGGMATINGRTWHFRYMNGHVRHVLIYDEHLWFTGDRGFSAQDGFSL